MLAPFSPLSFCYADPPYLGMCGRYGHRHEGEFGCWDDLETHRVLVNRLTSSWPDGWAMSGTSVSLRSILSLTPPETRVLSWVKPFASWKPGQRLAYTWEPVLLFGGRQDWTGENTTRDHLVEPAAMQKGLFGAKPPAFARWVFDALGADPRDRLTDLFPGTGVVGHEWRKFIGQTRLFPMEIA